MTIHELQEELRAYVDRAKHDALRDRSVAWMSAMLQRAKRLPRYERFVEASEKPALTAEEIAKLDTDIEELAASAGLTVWRGEDSDGAV